MKLLVIAAALLLSANVSLADSSQFPKDGILIAQDAFDAYDPFADYSEFDEATDEEADIYFFKNGRFFSIGLLAGYRMFTDTMGQIYKPNPSFGLTLSYFFDLRLAAQVSYSTGDHPFDFTANGNHYFGKITVSGFGFDLKYYLNVQNVTKGISEFNPYIFGGLSQLSREMRRADSDETGKDSSMAFQVGIGTEFPMVKNKYHLGIEALYQYVNFPDEGGYMVIDGQPTTIRMNGDAIKIQAVLGFNF